MTALTTFYQTYGEFFATWKLWTALERGGFTSEPTEVRRWQLLERAEVAEGRFEALLIKLASERHLSQLDVTMLGSFREAYQMLREAIEEGQPLNWWASGPVDTDVADATQRPLAYVQYQAFKALAEYVAVLLERSPTPAWYKGRPVKPTSTEAIEAFTGITKRQDFRDQWWLHAAQSLRLKS